MAVWSRVPSTHHHIDILTIEANPRLPMEEGGSRELKLESWSNNLNLRPVIESYIPKSQSQHLTYIKILRFQKNLVSQEFNKKGGGRGGRDLSTQNKFFSNIVYIRKKYFRKFSTLLYPTLPYFNIFTLPFSYNFTLP